MTNGMNHQMVVWDSGGSHEVTILSEGDPRNPNHQPKPPIKRWLNEDVLLRLCFLFFFHDLTVQTCFFVVSPIRVLHTAIQMHIVLDHHSPWLLLCTMLPCV